MCGVWQKMHISLSEIALVVPGPLTDKLWTVFKMDCPKTILVVKRIIRKNKLFSFITIFN